MTMFLSIFLSISVYAGGMVKCHYPSPDSSDSSAPSAVGKVIALDVKTKSMRVETSDSKMISIDLGKVESANLFTQFGGAISLGEIKTGETVEIWLNNCSKPKKENNIAEVVRVKK